MVFSTSDFKARFFADNVARAQLTDATRALVSASTGSGRVLALADGTPALALRDRVLGADLAPESVFEVTKRAGSRATFVVFGLGMGHTVRALRAFSSAHTLVFEPDPGVVRSFFESGPSDLGEVPIVCTTHELSQLWPRFSHGKTVTVINTPGYVELFPEQAHTLRETVALLLQRSGINDATHNLRSRVWVRDVLDNLELLREHPSFLALTGKYRGVPAFIVGAGPSLGKNGHLVAEATKKGIVFAVNSSARALERHGAEPQVLACMESLDVSNILSQVSYIDRVARAFSLTAHPSALRTGKGPLLHVFEGIVQLNAPLKELTGHNGLSVSGSVTTLVFSLAERLGCSPIVFVGQDLAYTDGKAYAQGTPYEASRVRVGADGHSLEHDWCDTLKKTHNQDGAKMHEREPLCEATAWGGHGSVLSTLGFGAVRAWLEAASIVLQRERPEVRLVNATEGGARIAGFEETTLAELLREMPERNITAQDLASEARAAQAPLDDARLGAWALRQAELAAEVRRAARRIRKLSEASRSAVERGHAAVVNRSFKKLELAERALRDAVQRMPFVDAWAHAEIGNLDKGTFHQAARDDHDSAVRSLAHEHAVAEVIEHAASEVERELRKVKLRFHAETSPFAPMVKDTNDSCSSKLRETEEGT